MMEKVYFIVATTKFKSVTTFEDYAESADKFVINCILHWKKRGMKIKSIDKLEAFKEKEEFTNRTNLDVKKYNKLLEAHDEL